jgi:hypothetical protein
MKNNEKKVVVVIGYSESGDDYGPWVFDERPSEEFMEAFLRKEAPGEFEEDGPGDFGSCVSLRYNECVILRDWLSPKNLPHRTPILVKHVGIYGAEEHPVVYMGFCTMEDGVNVLLLTHPTKPSAKLWGEEIQKIIGWKALPQ